MRRLLFIISIGLMIGIVGLSQTLPITRTLEWDPNPVSDEVFQYEVRLDGNLVGLTAATSIPFTITSLGTHTATVIARNMWGDSDPSTLSFNVSKPGKSNNIRIK